MNKKILITIILIVIISFFMMTLIIPAYLNSQSDDLLTITYSCTTGIMPGFTGWKMYDNGTYTIDMDSCAWIKNINYKPASMEYQEINSMSCPEIIQRDSINEPYQNNENKVFAEFKIKNCNFTKKYSETLDK